MGEKITNTYQLAYYKNGEWWHLLGLSNYSEALEWFNKENCSMRLICHQTQNHMYAKYHVDEGIVLMEK